MGQLEKSALAERYAAQTTSIIVRGAEDSHWKDMEGVVQFGLIEFGEDGCSKQKVIGDVVVDFSWGL